MLELFACTNLILGNDGGVTAGPLRSDLPLCCAPSALIYPVWINLFKENRPGFVGHLFAQWRWQKIDCQMETAHTSKCTECKFISLCFIAHSTVFFLLSFVSFMM